jgi:hypothetical protein
MRAWKINGRDKKKEKLNKETIEKNTESAYWHAWCDVMKEATEMTQITK